MVRNAEYRDMLHLLNEAIGVDSDSAVAERNCGTIIRFLETRLREDTQGRTGGGLALGVSEADLALCHSLQEQ